MSQPTVTSSPAQALIRDPDGSLRPATVADLPKGPQGEPGAGNGRIADWAPDTDYAATQPMTYQGAIYTRVSPGRSRASFDGTEASGWVKRAASVAEFLSLLGSVDAKAPQTALDAEVNRAQGTETVLGQTIGQLVTVAAQQIGSNAHVNTGQFVFSDAGWNPLTDPPPGLTTPTTARVFIGGHYADDGGGGVFYHWGQIAYLTNPGTAPMTGIQAKVTGYQARGLGASVRQSGNGGDAHACELLIGQTSAQALVTATNGSSVLPVTAIGQQGSRWDVGDTIAGEGIPAGATITAIDSQTAPTQITLSAPVSGLASSPKTIRTYANGQVNSTIGLLITGLGASGSEGGLGNPGGTAIAVQSQQATSAFLKGLRFGPSALQATGIGVSFESAVTGKGISFDSGCQMTSAFALNGGSYTGSVIGFSGVQSAASGLKFTQTCSFGSGAIFLEGQDIATDTVLGMRLGTTASQLLGFWGKTPTAKPAAYTLANVVDTRALDPTTATLSQVAQVLGTALADLKKMGLVG